MALLVCSIIQREYHSAILPHPPLHQGSRQLPHQGSIGNPSEMCLRGKVRSNHIKQLIRPPVCIACFHTTLSSPCLKLYPSVQLQFGCKNVMHLQARSLPCRLFGDEFEYRFWKVALHFMTLERLRISKSQYRVGYEYHYQGWICRCTMYTGGGVGTASCTMWSYVSSIHSSPFR